MEHRKTITSTFRHLRTSTLENVLRRRTQNLKPSAYIFTSTSTLDHHPMSTCQGGNKFSLSLKRSCTCGVKVKSLVTKMKRLLLSHTRHRDFSLLTFWAVGVAEEYMQEECKDTGLSFSASVHCTNRDCETVTQCIH